MAKHFDNPIDAAIYRSTRRFPDILEALSESARESEAYVLEEYAQRQEGRAHDAVRDFLIAHPGVVYPDPNGDLVYTEKYLRFAAGLAAPGQPGQDMSMEKLASVAGVPLTILEAWIHSQPEDG